MSKGLRKIEVKQSKDGYKPKEKNLCLYKGEESCESASGSALCGGNMGMKKVGKKEYVLCQNPPPDE